MTADPTAHHSTSELRNEPWYLPLGDEVQMFEAAYQARLPVLLKGPTGCGKTRFVEYMAWRLFRHAESPRRSVETPLITVACHEDLTATDLVGRYLLAGDETVWIDGPLTRAVRNGALCYLDEVVEARKDTTVVVHALTDHRRVLPIEKTGELLDAHPDFLLLISYNPGYQSILKDLKPSTRQRMVAIDLGYPPPDLEIEIIVHESGAAEGVAAELVQLGQAIRRLEGSGLREVVSTRALVSAGALHGHGLSAREAAIAAVVGPLTDDAALQAGLVTMVENYISS